MIEYLWNEVRGKPNERMKKERKGGTREVGKGRKVKGEEKGEREEGRRKNVM